MDQEPAVPSGSSLFQFIDGKPIISIYCISITDEARYQNFDTWNWQERAAEIELHPVWLAHRGTVGSFDFNDFDFQMLHVWNAYLHLGHL